MEQQDPREEGIEPWNVMLDQVRRQSERELQSQIHAIGPQSPRRVRRLLRRWMLAATSDPISIVLRACAASTAVSAAVLVLWKLPVWGSGADYSGVVIGAASAVAFGSIVLSVVGESFGRAGDLAPGYTSVVMAQMQPWLSGLNLILVSGLLFVYSLFQPSRAGAVAGVLLAVSAVLWSWISARRALADSDPLILAQKAGAHYRRSVRRMARYGRKSLLQVAPEAIRRDPEAARILTRGHERDLVAGMMRQLAAGASAARQRGNIAEMVVLTTSLGEAFLEYADEAAGEVGPYDGLTGICLSVFSESMRATVEEGDNAAASYLTNALVELAVQPFGHPDYAAVRTLVRRQLQQELKVAWDDDKTTLAGAAVTGVGRLARQWIQMGAWQDTYWCLDDLSTSAGEAMLQERHHISIYATGALADLLPVLASDPMAPRRTEHLDRWTKAVRVPASLGPATSESPLGSAADALVPGATLAGTSMLQLTAWQTPDYAVPEVAAALNDVMRDVGPYYLDHRSDRQSSATEPVALAYVAAMLLARSRYSNSVTADIGAAASGICTSLGSWVSGAAGKIEILDYGDALERLWSALLTCGYAADDAEIVANISSEIGDSLLPLPPSWNPSDFDAGFQVAFLTGLLLVGGRDREVAGLNGEVDHRFQRQSPLERLGGLSWGMHGSPLGRVPSLRRSEVLAPPESLLEAVERWAVSTWPGISG